MPGSDCLALMWPSRNEEDVRHSFSPGSHSTKTHLGGTLMQTTHRQDSMKISSPHGEGSLSLDRTAEVLVCPSGQTVVRVKASMEALLPSPSHKGSPSSIKQLMLPYSPSATQRDRSRLGISGSSASPWPLSGGPNSPSLSFPGRSLLFDSGDPRHSTVLPSPGRSPTPTRNIGSGGDTPMTPPSSAKRPRRRKFSAKDKGDKTRFIGGAKGILEQDHPEEDVSSHSRCPCFKFFLVVCLIAMFLAVLFYLSLWLVAQHRGSPVIIAGGESLQTLLQLHIFGQPIVASVLPQLLSGILAMDTNDRTMVIMFHGQSGVGKTFVADLLAKKLFPDQAQDKCTHKFLPSFAEVRENLVSPYDYSIALEDFIDQGKTNYRTCPVGLYCIEDIDYDTSSSLVDAIALTLPGIRKRQAHQEQKMIFILNTNLQGDALGQYLFEKLNEGKSRDDITLTELEPIMKAFPEIAENGNMETNSDSQQSKVNSRSVHSKLVTVVDHHIPFFPLEREHVILCIERTLSRKNQSLAEDDIQWIADKLSYFPESYPVFSVSGCKKVEEKANLLSRYSQTSHSSEEQ